MMKKNAFGRLLIAVSLVAYSFAGGCADEHEYTICINDMGNARTCPGGAQQNATQTLEYKIEVMAGNCSQEPKFIAGEQLGISFKCSSMNNCTIKANEPGMMQVAPKQVKISLKSAIESPPKGILTVEQYCFSPNICKNSGLAISHGMKFLEIQDTLPSIPTEITFQVTCSDPTLYSVELQNPSVQLTY